MLALLLAACAIESPACYTAQATLRVGARTAEVRVVSRDLPFPGDMNRWSYTLEAPVPMLDGYETDRLHTTKVCGDAAGIWALGAWHLALRPTAPHVAAWRAGRTRTCREIRWSVLRWQGRVEILLEEPASFGQGRSVP